VSLIPRFSLLFLFPLIIYLFIYLFPRAWLANPCTCTALWMCTKWLTYVRCMLQLREHEGAVRQVQPSHWQHRAAGEWEICAYALPVVLYGCETWSLA
jgi:hypothetical protein